MEYRIGKDKRISDRGQTEMLVCPKCKNNVKFSVFSNKDLNLLAKLPLVKIQDVFFLVCPECAGVFGVDNAKGKEFKNGEPLAIGNYDLKELTQFKL